MGMLERECHLEKSKSPGGQVPAPINVGLDNQYKRGFLAIGTEEAHSEAAVWAEGEAYGVYSQSTAPYGKGVYGRGVYGVYGYSPSYYGVRGVGEGPVSIGVSGYGGWAGVYGYSLNWAGYFDGGDVNIRNGRLCFNGANCRNTWPDAGADDDWTDAGSGKMYATHTTDKVGIGTTDPGYKLDVQGPGGGGPGPNDIVAIQSTDPGNSEGARLLLGSRSNPDAAGIAGQNTWDGRGELRFYTDNAGTFAQRAVITSTGNVGIGITAPWAKLHVNAAEQSYGVYTTGASYGVYSQGKTAGVYGAYTTIGIPLDEELGQGWLGKGYTGVVGEGSTGVYGKGSHGYGVHGQGSTAGVYGKGSDGVKGEGGHGVVGWTTSDDTEWGEGAVGVAHQDGTLPTNWWSDATSWGALGRSMGGNYAGVYGQAGISTGDASYGGYFKGTTSDSSKTAYGVMAIGGSALECGEPSTKECSEQHSSYTTWFNSESECDSRCNVSDIVGVINTQLPLDKQCPGIDLPECSGVKNGRVTKWATVQSAINRCSETNCVAGPHSHCCDAYVIDSEKDTYKDETYGNFNKGVGTGLYATGGQYGVYAETMGNPDNDWYSTAAGYFKAGRGTGVYGESTYETGVEGKGGIYGVYGQGETVGVYGKRAAGIMGYLGANTNLLRAGLYEGKNTGVMGKSNDYGVFGRETKCGHTESCYSAGVVGIGHAIGGWGESNTKIRPKVEGRLGASWNEERAGVLGIERSLYEEAGGARGDKAYAGYFLGDVKITGELLYGEHGTQYKTVKGYVDWCYRWDIDFKEDCALIIVGPGDGRYEDGFFSTEFSDHRKCWIENRRYIALSVYDKPSGSAWYSYDIVGLGCKKPSSEWSITGNPIICDSDPKRNDLWYKTSCDSGINGGHFGP